jgi:hypothetical protein
MVMPLCLPASPVVAARVMEAHAARVAASDPCPLARARAAAVAARARAVLAAHGE